MSIAGEESDPGPSDLALLDVPGFVNVPLSNEVLHELFAAKFTQKVIEEDPATSPEEGAEETSLVEEIASRLDLSRSRVQDTPESRIAIAEAALYAWQLQRFQELANTVDHRGMLNDEAVALQARLLEFLEQNGGVPLLDKLDFARLHQVQGITLGQEFNVANFHGTKQLDAKIRQFLRELELKNENIVRIPREAAQRKTHFDVKHIPGYAVISRTRDVAWINNEAGEAPSLGGRIDTAVRKKSYFLLDLSNEKLRMQFALFQKAIDHLSFSGVQIDTRNERIRLVDGAEHRSEEIDKAVEAVADQKKFLDDLIERMIERQDEPMIPISTLYYARQYNHHRDLGRSPTED